MRQPSEIRTANAIGEDVIVQTIHNDAHRLEFISAGWDARECKVATRSRRRRPHLPGVQVSYTDSGVRRILFLLCKDTLIADTLDAGGDLRVDVCHCCRVAGLVKIQTGWLGGDGLQTSGVKVSADRDTKDQNIRFAIAIQV